MILTALCSSCQRTLKVESPATTRPELEMERGRELTLNCNNCGSTNKKHVNRITAEVDNTIIIGGIILGIVLTIGLVMFFGWIFLLTISFPILIWRWEMNKAHAFNQYRVRN